MTLRGWAAAACVAVLTVACDANSTNRSDDSTAITNESASRDDSPATGTSGLAGDTERFAKDAMMANKAESELGQLALERGQNASVKQFAKMMVQDHTQALTDLKQATSGAAVAEPADLDSKHQSLYDRLSKLSGAEFDREYMKAMVDGHRDVEKMVGDRADDAPAVKGTTGRNADDSQVENAVTQWAGKALPVVSQHRQKAEQIYSQLK